MREVSIRILHVTLDLARTGGVDSAPLLAGLPSLARVDGEWPLLFDWSDFIVMWHRLEEALGGPEGFERVARAAMRTAYPFSRELATVYVTCEALFEFLMLRHMRMSFRNVINTIREKQPDGWIHFRETIRRPYPGCEALHRATRTFVSHIPLNFDLPDAEVEILELTPQAAELRVRFPTAPAAAASKSPVSELLVSQLDEALSLIIDATDRQAEGPKVSVEAWADRLGLSPRQEEVFTRLLEGRANKEIAALLRCSERNVEFHVGKIFRAARVASRAELLAKVLGHAR